VTTGLRLELFVADVERSLIFYTEVLGFQVVEPKFGGYRPLQRDAVRIGVQSGASLQPGHPLTEPGPPGLGIELVLEVGDLVGLRDHAHQRWPLSADLTDRPWGLTDFRIQDPDGYFWRVTTA